MGMARPLAKLLSMLTPKRRWAQFSLATMFVVVTVLCVSLGWLRMRWAHCNRQAAAILALGVRNAYETEPTAPAWVCRMFGKRSFENVIGLSLIRGHYNDADLKPLAELTELRRLVLSEPFPFVHSVGLITDTTLPVISALSKLQTLDVRGTKVTGAGVAELQKALPDCNIVR
jgi:hypothetical protein